MAHFFINKKNNKLDNSFGMNFTSVENAVQSAINLLLVWANSEILKIIADKKSIEDVLIVIQDRTNLCLVELSHELTNLQANDLEFIFLEPSRTDTMLSQTSGDLPSGRWVPKISEISSDHLDGEFRHIDIFFNEDENCPGITIAKVNEKTGYVDWCCPEYKNHPQVFEHIANL